LPGFHEFSIPLSGFTGIIMRPTKQESDLEYWIKSLDYWSKKLEEHKESMPKDDLRRKKRPIVSLWATERLAYLEQQVFRCQTNFDEARGLIIAYSGRAKPKWFNAPIVLLSPQQEKEAIMKLIPTKISKKQPGKIPAFTI
jgi:hypothetical protein